MFCRGRQVLSEGDLVDWLHLAEAAQAVLSLTGGQRLLRAWDLNSGTLLWEAPLAGSGAQASHTVQVGVIERPSDDSGYIGVLAYGVLKVWACALAQGWLLLGSAASRVAVLCRCMMQQTAGSSGPRSLCLTARRLRTPSCFLQTALPGWSSAGAAGESQDIAF